MCGFAGLFNNLFSLNKQQVSDIAGCVSFRGPDSQGIRLFDHEFKMDDKGINVLFFNRLAILDLDARSDQPFEDERYSLVFNGEIYNYAELKNLLVREGYSFHTSSDTEVLFYSLQLWGVKALERLNGMFAFCWIDRKEKRFLLARDRMGIKPLYFQQQGKVFRFSSELDSILRLSDTLPEIEPSAVQMFLWMQFIPTPFTIVKGVFKLPPGHYLQGTWKGLESQERLEPVSYWDAYSYVPTPDKNINITRLEGILQECLSRQLVADVPLGLFLSSGVDSSLLAALVNKYFAKSNKFNFFTVAFGEDTSSDESQEALTYIRGFNNPSLVSHTLFIDSQLLGNHLDNLYNYFDEPFGDPASLLNWVISKKAREHVKVALSGDGADELFWGYRRYGQWKQPSLSLFNRLDIGKGLAKCLRPFLPGQYWKAKASLELEPDPLYRHFTLFLAPVLIHLMDKPVWQQPIWAIKGVEGIKLREDLVAMLDIKTYLADAMLYKVDRASMAESLEIRVPYLDNSVIDYALSLPFQNKSNVQFEYKAIMKLLLKQLAPHFNINRPKKGFNFPLDKWLRFSWRDRALSLINKNNLNALGLDDVGYLKILQQYYRGDKKNCIAVWFLLNLVIWHNKFKKIPTLKYL
jgi:asparagine synthase (glutamine-hydrolysing)